MHWQANWITPSVDYDKGSAILFEKTFTLRDKLQKATLYISSLGIYEARLSGARVGAFIFAPGWTEYIKRIQYQTYDVTALLTKKTLFEIELGTGWMRGRIARIQPGQKSVPPAVIAELHIDYADGTSEVIVTDEAWHVRRSPILFSDIYDGEVCDARFRDRKAQAVKLFPYSRRVLIATEGEEIREQERLSGRLIKTPRGETVLDFGQNMTGYIEFRVMAKEGEEVRFDCAEVLDADGNFYRDNYRSAKSTLSYICREGLIAQAFYAHSTDLVIRAGRILGKDVAPYEALYRGIGRSFRKMWQEDYRTQTECALALHFHLTNAPKETAARLAAMVHDNGDRLTTGFVGTPYLLHALSENGYADVAYSLLLQENFPSWLFSVRMGATTMWEHWDGQGADGSFWSEKMNSFNHYAYGAVADWVYTVALGIRRTQDAPGFQRVDIAPTPDPRLSHLGCRLKTRQGLLSSRWVYEEDFIRYEITVPCPSNIVIDGKTHEVDAGSYLFCGKKG